MTLSHTLPVKNFAAQVPSLMPLSGRPIPLHQSILIYPVPFPIQRERLIAQVLSRSRVGVVLTVLGQLGVALFITWGPSFLVNVAAVDLLAATQNIFQCRITISLFQSQILHSARTLPLTPLPMTHGSLWWKLKKLR